MRELAFSMCFTVRVTPWHLPKSTADSNPSAFLILISSFLFMSEPRFAVAQLDEIPPTPCPCGQARRAFKEDWNTLASVHLTDIHADSRAHYHQKMTEIYIVLEGEGHLEADGQIIPLKPMTTVMIRPGCVHRAVGKLKIINVPMPPFDPADEFEV
jgi:mannose-6-phosphate isomerase-like protein (cupin superfamily)